MQINGDKFLRNLEIERERAELERQKEELMSQKTQSYVNPNDPYRFEEKQSNINYQELDDIRLQKDSSNKQKYILLGFVLILLFLITIVTIKLISETNEKDPFSNDAPTDDKKIEATFPTNPQTSAGTMEENKTLDIDKIIQSEENANLNTEQKVGENTQSKPLESDVFGIEKKEVDAIHNNGKLPQETPPKEQTPKVVPPKVIKQAEPKVIKEVKESAKKEIIKKNTEIKKETPKKLFEKVATKETTQNGKIFIQVGAFETVPDKALIGLLEKNNYKYTYQKVEINGKPFSKLLVGGYSSQDKALEDLVKIRNEINPKAFIPKGQ